MSNLEHKYTVLAMFTLGAPEAFLVPEIYDTVADALADARNLIEFEGAETVTIYSYPINSKGRNHMEPVSRHSQHTPNFDDIKFEEEVSL